MRYEVDIKPRARKDLHDIPKQDAAKIVTALEAMQEDLAGDVKRLTNFTPEFRLCVGDYRVLFEIERTSHGRDIPNSPSSGRL
jgi:mRNA interferase RelE/StbE